MPASSVASGVSQSRSNTRPAKPHVLGGSNNLRTERQRREKAELALQRANGRLKAVKEELAPHVLQLSDAVKSLQIEKRHHLELEEASQDVLEALQAQMNALEAWQQRFPVLLDERLDRVVQQVQEHQTAESHRFRLLLDDLRSAQEEHATELRLVHHEYLSSREHLSNRINVAEDAIEGVRSDCARSTERQLSSLETHAAKLAEVDEKAFILDKEVLRLKMALPASVAARMSAGSQSLQFTMTDQQSSRAGVAVDQRLGELSEDLKAVKADAVAARSADRQQFEALTNRLREAARSSQRFQQEVETRMVNMETSVKQVVTKVPSELSRRLLQAQRMWDAELQTLKARVQQFEAERQRSEEAHKFTTKGVGDNLTSQVDLEHLSRVQTSLDDLRSDVLVAQSAHEATRTAALARIAQVETDMLGLYDWTRAKVSAVEQELAYTTELVGFFSRHAKLQPT